MSEVSQGPGWWQASDGRWYPPQAVPAPPDLPASPMAAPGPGAVYAPVATAPPRTNGLAVTSLVLGILAFVTCAVTGIPGLITGVIARRQIAEAQGTEQGGGLAVGGIVTSAVALALVLLWLVAILAITFLGSSATSRFSAIGSAVN